MTYQVLARKWRPKDFASLVGQEHVVRALTHALDGGRLHHAYLFTGTRGVGKTTLSRIFAKALNCETGVTSTPCGVCRACREIDEGRFVDYVEMDAASNRGVDEMAQLLERAVYAPVDARFKVYMIDEVHMLTNHAFNAMLKTLEEPPSHVKFILATTDPQKIPVTVLSRCLQFNLKQMPAGHIVSHLEHILGEEQVPYEAQALRLLARAADGSMRDALSLTDQAIAYSANQVTEDAVRGMLGALDQNYLIRLLDALAASDGTGVLAIADEMSLRSLSFSTALQDLASLLHRIAWAQFAPQSVLDEWPEAADLRRFAESLDAAQVQLFYQIATIGRSELGLAPDQYAGFTMTLLRMLAFEPATGGGSNTGSGGRSAVAAGASGKRAPAAAVSAGGASAAPPVPTHNRALEVVPKPVAPTPAAPESGKAAPVSSNEAAAAEAVAAPEIAEAESRSSALNADSAEQAASVASLAPASDVTEIGRAVAAVASASSEPDTSAEITAPNEAAPVTAAPEVAEALNAPPAPTAPTTSEARGDAASRRPTGASAALDVLRSAGMKLNGSRTNAASPAARGEADTAKPSAAKSAAPRVVVPTPDPARRAAAAAQAESGAPRRDTAPSARANAGTRSSTQSTSTGDVPPWDDMPPDEGMPLSSEDAYFASFDDGFVPAFDNGSDNGPDDSRAQPTAQAHREPAVDLASLPPAIALGPLGFDGDWPALAATLPLTGIAHQLAFNSELMTLDGTSLKLSVPVPQYADSTQVAKLKAALVERLGKAVDVQVEVGAARRTAAAHAAAARAERQREAEREIDADPFVRSLIRDFGASIVPGSVRPLDAAQGGGASAH